MTLALAILTNKMEENISRRPRSSGNVSYWHQTEVAPRPLLGRY
jgi:hypothetical protein